MGQPCYELATVWFRYADPWILEAFDLTIDAGEFLGVIGPNGSGKTSLLKLMAGLLHPQEGVVRLQGHDLSILSPREIARHVAVVPQESHVLFPFTVAELVLMGRFMHQKSWGWESAKDLRIAFGAMEIMDVERLAQRTFSELSGGERHRAVIARALAQQAPILLLDEPTAFLDLKHQMDIYAVLKALHRDHGVTVVLVSHDLNLASQHCERLVLLHEGRPFRSGPPADVLTAEHLRMVYGCEVLLDHHPTTGTPRITLPQPEPVKMGSESIFRSEPNGSTHSGKNRLRPHFRRNHSPITKRRGASQRGRQTQGKMVRIHHGAATVSGECTCDEATGETAGKAQAARGPASQETRLSAISNCPSRTREVSSCPGLAPFSPGSFSYCP
jgi:ABC-type cobalamin/Fe3+-siderophores transport system ATPase subunit